MHSSTSEYFTSQFYMWEYRGRGWYLAPAPIQLEPAFIPFVRYIPQRTPIDDGKRHTLVSKLIEAVTGTKKPPADSGSVLDYEKIEAFVFERDDDLCALQIRLSKERTITPERMEALLLMLSSVGGQVSFEILGNAREIVVQFVCGFLESYPIAAQINAYFPEATVVRDDMYLELFEGSGPITVVDFGLQEEFVRPLATVKNFNVDFLTGVVGVLDNLTGIQQAGIQILFSGTINRWSESILQSVTLHDRTSFFADAPEAPKLAAEKTKSPLFAVTVRAFAQAEDAEESGTLLSILGHALMIGSKSPHNALIPLPNPEYDFEARIDDIYMRRSHRLGMLINADELVNLLHFPPEHIQSARLFSGTGKTKALPAIVKGRGLVLGTSVHEGRVEDVSYTVSQRMKHTYVIGATGTGKSTLLLSMIAQDISNGNGVAVLDPHGDLIEALLSYIPTERLQDVVIVDPSDSDYPVAFNILRAHSEIEKEILSSDLVAAFKRLSTSWGDQMHSVFSNAVLAFLESDHGGTLSDLRRFLIEPAFRNEFLRTVSDPHIRYYWQKEYPLLKTNSIGPILTRLDTFLRSKLIRNMVCQQKGLDFSNILDTQKILLVKLPQGLIGIENSYLLGTLIVAKIQQAALARQAIQNRKQFYLYIDEFHHFITPSLASILTGVRKYELGLVLAHQDMQQLVKDDSDVASAIIGSVGTRVCFRVGEIDAKRLAEGFTFFDAQDLQNLGTGDAIARIERPEFDFSFTTKPPSPSPYPHDRKNQIIAWSRERYAKSRELVEKELWEGLAIQPNLQNVQPSSPRPAKEKLSGEQIPVVPKREPLAIRQEDAQKTIDDLSKKKEESQHRYLQTLIKKMAESRGYKATIEAGTPDGKGKVDVLLEKNNTQIACEVSVTTDAVWELHNIQKCLAAGYGEIVCCMSNEKTTVQLQQKVQENLSEAQRKKIRICQPETLFAYLDSIAIVETTKETTFKGYRVKVSYDSLSTEEMKGMRESVTKIVTNSIKKTRRQD